MVRPSFVIVLLLALVFAGCAQAPPEPTTGTGRARLAGEAIDFPEYGKDRPLHSVKEILPFSALAPDGIELAGHVYIPDGEGPFATILEYSPYWSTTQGKSEEQAVEVEGRRTMVGHFAKFIEAGFAVAVINIRGTGLSGGCNSWFHAAVDGPDAAAVIEGLAKQPWSNGKVGMIGLSWPGYSQYAVLIDPPPALKAIAPSSGVPDAWTLFTRRGPPINTQFGPMAIFYGVALGVTIVGIEGVTSPDHVACPSYVTQAQGLNQLNTFGDKDAFWQARDNRLFVENSSVPMFVTNGLTNGEGHILQFEGLWDLMPTERRMLLGQWGHSYPQDEKGDVYDQEIIAWFDHYLRDGPKLLETGVVEYQDDEDEWHMTTQWPPASKVTALYLSDNALIESPDSVAASRKSFVGNSVDPGPFECAGVQALYVSPPVAEDIEIAGNFLVNLTVESSLPNSNFGAFLYHVKDIGDCNDRAAALENLQADISPSWPGEVRRALSDLRHRGGYLQMGEDFPVGESDYVRMSSHPFASHVKAGERLVLAIGGGSGELSPRPEMPLITIVTGDGVEGFVTIPVTSGTLRFA